jgi:hypothetical protein
VLVVSPLEFCQGGRLCSLWRHEIHKGRDLVALMCLNSSGWGRAAGSGSHWCVSGVVLERVMDIPV